MFVFVCVGHREVPTVMRALNIYPGEKDIVDIILPEVRPRVCVCVCVSGREYDCD